MSDMAPAGLTGDPTIDAILQGSAPTGAGLGLPEPIGGFAQGPRVEGPVTADGQYPVAADWEPYRAGDEFAILRALPLEHRVRLQDEMVALGLASSVIPGEIDDATVRGLTSVLAMANRTGSTWEGTLGRLRALERQGLLDEARSKEFDTPTYLAPDYATIAQRVKDTFRSQLGRDPDESEMAVLVGELQGWDRQSFDAEVSAREGDFVNQQTAGQQAGGTQQGVDPLARFQQVFEQRYANELDFVEDKQVAKQSRAALQSATETLSDMSGGA